MSWHEGIIAEQALVEVGERGGYVEVCQTGEDEAGGRIDQTIKILPCFLPDLIAALQAIAEGRRPTPARSGEQG